MDLRKKLNIDPTLNITFDMLYEPTPNGGDTDRSLGETGITRAKAQIFAEKMGYIGDQKIDVNEFLNHQIEEAYLKIEHVLNGKLDNLKLLQKKIDKLEGNDDEFGSEMPKSSGIETATSLSAKVRKEKALKPKGKYDIDLVPNEKKVLNLQNTIKNIKHQLQIGAPPEPWKPTSAQDAILDMKQYDALLSKEKLTKSNNKKLHEQNIATVKETLKEKSIYARDMEDLIKNPLERSLSPRKYG